VFETSSNATTGAIVSKLKIVGLTAADAGWRMDPVSALIFKGLVIVTCFL